MQTALRQACSGCHNAAHPSTFDATAPQPTYAELTSEASQETGGPRVVGGNVNSLLLRKFRGELAHGGGDRRAAGFQSQYNTVESWVLQGAGNTLTLHQRR